jgi:hypothetical protein
MDVNRFNAEVRPFLTEVPIGSQGIAFDRLDIDAWVDNYVACNGRPGRKKGGNKPWRKEAEGFRKGAESGTSTSESSAAAFAKALERATSKRPNNT